MNFMKLGTIIGLQHCPSSWFKEIFHSQLANHRVECRILNSICEDIRQLQFGCNKQSANQFTINLFLNETSINLNIFSHIISYWVVSNVYCSIRQNMIPWDSQDSLVVPSIDPLITWVHKCQGSYLETQLQHQIEQLLVAFCFTK